MPSTPAIFACLGDSIVRNGPSRAHSPWTARLDRTLAPAYGAVNRGRDSTVTSEWLTRYGATIDTFGYAGIVIGPCAFNDTDTGIALATSWANIQAIKDDALGRGMFVVLVTALPAGTAAGWNPTKQAAADTLRASILGVTPHPNLAVVDAKPAFAAPGFPNNMDPQWQGPDQDGCHIGDDGGDLLASLVLTAIQSLVP